MKSYQPFFSSSLPFFSIRGDHRYLLENLFGGSRISGHGHSITVFNGNRYLERFVYLVEGQKIGVDFDFKTGEFRHLAVLGSGYQAETYITSGNKLQEAIFPKKNARVEPVKKSPLGEVPKETLVPKTQDFKKDILKGSEVFKDAERKIRIFLRSSHGGGNKNIFILAGAAGVGKSISSKDALNKECGRELSPEQLHQNLESNSFDTADFELRLKAKDAIDQAKNLYRRYLHNYELSGSDEGRLVPEDNKQKALLAVQNRLGDKLYGYKLSIADLEGQGKIEKSASDVLLKLKKLGGEDVRAPYNPANGWSEIPAQLSNKELYMNLYQANGKTLFVDEGDYFIVNDNPWMKIAFNNGPFRKISFEKKGYTEVNGRIIPGEFIYSGKIVITTNVPASQWNPAIKSRANTYFFYLTRDQLFDRLRDIIPAIQKRDLPHLPAKILIGMRNTLMKLAKKDILKTFDFRTFVALCDEFALILEDEIKEAQQINPAITFSIYGNGKSVPSDQAVEEFKNSEEGKKIWVKASSKFKKTLLNQIQQMNREKASEDDPNIFDLEPEEDAA